MSIEAINEQLLRAIGVGVALVDLDDLCLRSRNDTFASWFGDSEIGTRLMEIFPDLDPNLVTEALQAGSPFPAEVSFKLRRRTMSVAIELSPAMEAGEKIAVLVCQNITRIKELERCVRIVRSFLAMARHDPPNLETHSAKALITAAQEITQPLIAEAGIDLSVHIDEGFPVLEVDEVQITRVLIKLITNAADAIKGAETGSSIRIQAPKSTEMALLHRLHFLSVQEPAPPSRLKAETFAQTCRKLALKAF